jgi:hypothetical protein
MIDYINSNSGIITIVLFIVVLILLVYLLIKNNLIYQNFFVKKFSFNDFKDINVNTNEEQLAITIANKSFSDITINAIGLIYGTQYFDFKDLYIKQKKLNSENKIVISQRSFIKINLDINDIKKLIFSRIKKNKVNKIYCYVTDSFGNLSKAYAPLVKKELKTEYSMLLKDEAKKIKDTKIKLKEDRKQEFFDLIKYKKIKNEKLTFKEFLKKLFFSVVNKK